MSAKGRRAVANGLHDLVKEKLIFLYIYLPLLFTLKCKLMKNNENIMKYI